jgi:hypothetical protein
MYEDPDSNPHLKAAGNVGVANPISDTDTQRKLISPQSCCEKCGSKEPDSGRLTSVTPTPSYVYAIGKIEPRFPNLSIEKELAQVVGRTETMGLTDHQSLHAALSKSENRYLARQICWVLTIQEVETYLLVPREPSELDLLLSTIRKEPKANDLDVVIGLRGPIAPPNLCNGLLVPMVVVDHVYSFDHDALMEAIPRPEKTSASQFKPVAEEVFDRIVQLTDNSGATDEHRALNYLAMRYPGIYSRVAEAFDSNCSLRSVEVASAYSSGARRVLDVIFSFTDRRTDFTEKSSVRVDVTEEFPFLVKKMSPYLDLRQ